MNVKPIILFMFSIFIASSAFAQSGDYMIGEYRYSLDFENKSASIFHGTDLCEAKIHVNTQLGNFSWLHSVQMITIDFSGDLNATCNNFSLSMLMNHRDLFDAAFGPVTIQTIAVMNFSHMRSTTIEKI